MQKRLIIIGGGASGIALLANIVESLISANLSDMEILVVDKSRKIGPGLAYGTISDCNLMNTPAGTMGIYSHNPKHFLEWLNRNQEKWRSKFPVLNVSDYSTPPRRLYGIYLEHIAYEIQELSRCNKCRVVFQHDCVLDVDLNTDGAVVYFENSGAIPAQFVLFAIGGFESAEFAHLIGKRGYFNSPYPEQNLLKGIPHDQSVYIIGTRLSAIDAVLTLRSGGHQGKIYCVSRQGMLPLVQGGHCKYKRWFLTKEYFDSTMARKSTLPLNFLLRLIAKEISLAEGKSVKWTNLPHTRCNALTMLRYEISQVKKCPVRPWQTVLHSVNDMLDFTWERLSDEDRKKVCRHFLGIFLTYRAAMPLENAEKIYALIKKGELEVLPGLESIRDDPEREGFQVTIKHCDQNPIKNSVQFLINATGPSADVLKTKDPLICRLVKKGLFVPHRFEGIQLDPRSLNLIDAHEKIYRHVFAVGTLARGVHLVTNLLEYIVRVAGGIARDIVGQMKVKEGQREILLG